MPKEQIKKTIIILNEDEVRQVIRLALQDDIDSSALGLAIYCIVRELISKKVEAALRMRCG